VPAYSPDAVAEFAVGLILCLNRGIHRAYVRTRDNNFALDGLLGFDLRGRTVGVIGTGAIGVIVARIMRLGFGCEVLAADLHPNPELTGIGVRYAEPRELVAASDIVTLHCPLTPETHHVVNRESIARAKRGFMLINTSRGALVDAEALIDGLKSGQVGAAALDVYEQEADFFFENLSGEVIQDDVLQRLLTFPNVLLTGHQAFFTREALTSIAETTLGNVTAFERGEPLANRVTAQRAKPAAT
jgi:D-lactate dehydrogenase